MSRHGERGGSHTPPASLRRVVQVLLAVQAVAIAKILGQAAAAAHVVPLLTRLVQEDATDVRISVLENFSELVAVAGVRRDSRRPFADWLRPLN